MSDLKTIAVDSTTKRGLAMLKQHPRETFDDVIRRLIEDAAAPLNPPECANCGSDWHLASECKHPREARTGEVK